MLWGIPGRTALPDSGLLDFRIVGKQIPVHSGNSSHSVNSRPEKLLRPSPAIWRIVLGICPHQTGADKFLHARSGGESRAEAGPSTHPWVTVTGLPLAVTSKSLLHTNIPISEPQLRRFVSEERLRNQVSWHTRL